MIHLSLRKTLLLALAMGACSSTLDATVSPAKVVQAPFNPWSESGAAGGRAPAAATDGSSWGQQRHEHFADLRGASGVVSLLVTAGSEPTRYRAHLWRPRAMQADEEVSGWQTLPAGMSVVLSVGPASELRGKFLVVESNREMQGAILQNGAQVATYPSVDYSGRFSMVSYQFR